MARLIKASDVPNEKRCHYRDRNGRRCKCPPIQSHTLQKEGPLRSISANGHVMKIGDELRVRLPEQQQDFVKVGLKKASAFPLFCRNHDSELFAPIEGGEFALDRRSILLLSIRSVAMEYYKKVRSSRIFAGLSSEEANVDPEIAKLMARGARRGAEDGEKRIKQLFSDLHRGPHGRFCYVAARLNDTIPFAVTGAFEPELSLAGEVLLTTDDALKGWNSLACFIGNVGGRAHLVFAGYQKYRRHNIIKFLRSLITEDNFPVDAARAGLMFVENAYISPEYLQKMTEKDQDMLRALSECGVSFEMRGLDDLRLEMPISLPVIEEIISANLG